MYKKITLPFLLLLFLTANFCALSQTTDKTKYTIYEGKRIKKLTHYYKKHYQWGDDFFVLYKDAGEVTIQRFDSEFELTKEVKFKKFYNKIREQIEFIHQFDDKIVVFISKKNAKEKKDILYAKSISLKDFEVSDNKELLSTDYVLKAKDRDEYQVLTRFYYTITDDDKLIVEYRLKDSNGFYARFFDYDLEMIAQKQIEFQHPHDQIDIIDRTVDAAKNYYLITLVHLGESKDDDDYQLELFRVGEETESIAKRDIEVENGIIDEIAFSKSDAGEINLYGTVRNYDSKKMVILKKRGQPTGIFKARLNNDIDLENFVVHNFPKDLIVEKMSKKHERGYNREYDEKDWENPSFPYLKLKGLLSTKDDANIFLGEQSYMEWGENRGGTHYEKYYYNNILVSKIFPNGALGWMKNLVKYQTGNLISRDISITSTLYNGATHIFFMDNEKNLGKADPEIEYAYVPGHGGNLMSFKIDNETGDVSKNFVFNGEDLSSFRFAHKMSDNELIYEAYDKKGVRYIRINIE